MKYSVRMRGEAHDVDLDGDAVQIDGALVGARLTELEGTPIRMLTIGDRVCSVVVRRGSARGDYTLWVDGYRFDVEALDERTRAIRELSKLATAAKGPAPLIAPMPGLVVRVNVEAGQQVAPGQSLVVMEAMKMETELRAQAAGTVKRVNAVAGTAVEKGAVLVELE